MTAPSPAHSPPRVTAAVCAHDEGRFLPDVVGSLLAQTLPAAALECLVVDNASRDATPEILAGLAARHRGRLRSVVEPALGLSRARNAALEVATAPVVAFIDADAVADPAWLERLLAAFEDPRVGAAGGPVEIRWEHDRPRWWSPPLDEALNRWDPGPAPRELAYPAYPYGTNLAVRRDAARAAGGFHEALGRRGRRLVAGEEGELCLRLERAGWRIRAAPGALVHHRTAAHRLSRRFILRRAFTHGRSQRVVESMHGLRSERYLSWGGLAARLAGRAARGRLDLPFLKYVAFRVGYHVERGAGWRRDAEPAR